MLNLLIEICIEREVERKKGNNSTFYTRDGINVCSLVR